MGYDLLAAVFFILMTPALRQRDRVTLRYRRGKVTIEWPGGERSDARLDDARRLGERVAIAVAEQFRAPALATKPAA